MTWLSLLCPSCRPNDLVKWLDSLYQYCDDPKGIELSLTLEHDIPDYEWSQWGNVIATHVVHGDYNINQLVEICYKQSTSPFIFLSGDDSLCRTQNWDAIFQKELARFPDGIALVYPNDLIFGKELACYPVTSRKIMDSVPWPVPYKRYAIDDTIFDIVPYERRIYLPDVIMEHLHLKDEGPGKRIIKNGQVKYYPIDPELIKDERKLFNELKPERDAIRNKHFLTMNGGKAPLKILVGVSTQEMARQAIFYDYFNVLDRPEGTITTFAHGQSPAEARNAIIQQALDHNCSHVFLVDDDIALKPDTLKRLWKHDKDIVSGLYLKRTYPHGPIIFDNMDEIGYVTPIQLNGHSGLVPIKAAGFGCCLIKTDVFRRMEKPWVRLGELKKDGWCDDTGFFFRAHKAGIESFCDLNVHVGHMASVTIWPAFIDNKWMVNYDTQGEGSLIR